MTLRNLLFDETGKLMKERQFIWKRAFELLKDKGETNQHNLYLKVKKDKDMVKRLKNGLNFSQHK